MSVVPVGSRWRRRFSRHIYAKVIHVLDHRLANHSEPTRWIVFEETNESKGSSRSAKVMIASKSEFLHTFIHPTPDDDLDVPLP